MHPEPVVTAVKPLTDKEVADKLVAFCGVHAELDAATADKVGKILVEDKDEKVNADAESFKKLWRLMGGIPTVMTTVVITLFFKYFHFYKEGTQQEFSDSTAEE